MVTKQDVYDAHLAHPEWRAVDIAAALGCSSAYVRSTARRGSIPLPRRPRDAAPKPAKGPIHPNATWTQEQRDRIAALMLEGKSSREIAAHFPGKTRNAIIGIIMRDKRLSEIGLRGSSARPSTPKKAKQAAAPVSRTTRKVISPTPPIAPAAPVSLPRGDTHKAGRPLWMLGSRSCRWCINDPEPRTNGHLFCGEATEPGRPYCAHHERRSVGLGTRSERAVAPQLTIQTKEPRHG